MKVLILQLFLLHFFYGTDFEYWKIEIRTHLKVEVFVDYCFNGFEEPENDGKLTAAEMKNLEAKYSQDAKALSKIQMGVSRAYFAKIATCETIKQAWESLKTEVYGDENILISVTEKYEYIVVITEETKDLSKLSIKELVESFRAHEKRRFFHEDQPKETAFQFRTNENPKKFSKNQQKKNYNPKKKQDRDGSSKKIEEKSEKSSSRFCKVCKKTNHTAEKYWHKGKPQCNFCKKFGHIEKDCWHKKQEQAIFCEKREEEREENLFFASKSDTSTKSNEWYVDSGCSNHMTGDEKGFPLN
ncbi:uncharacterized protein [Solanum tuberosum]|uniref:uncharacterized protein n=1 Tax=Solanum tuberosum TaxID=4113 RepID=UPI00073A2A9F|nr:PREDICTED: uncharacterized protein LOC107058698 [Solanum tuberosum]